MSEVEETVHTREAREKGRVSAVELTLRVNGRTVTQSLPPHYTLLRWLRNAGIYDVRYGCGEGVCGACTVLVDGRTLTGCLTLALQVAGSEIRTAAALTEADGSLSELQKAFVEHGAIQCGFCTSGLILAAAEFLENGEPIDRQAVAGALGGNLCRCTGYQGAIEAILEAAKSREVG